MKRIYLFILLFTIVYNAIGQVQYSAQLVKQAKSGNAKAQLELSYCYADGIGVELNDSLAFEWCKKSSKNGNIDAYTQLGAYYYNGFGCEKNCLEALVCFRYAAAHGDEQAKKNINIIVEAGHEGFTEPDPLSEFNESFDENFVNYIGKMEKEETGDNVAIPFDLGRYYISHGDYTNAITHLIIAYKNLKKLNPENVDNSETFDSIADKFVNYVLNPEGKVSFEWMMMVILDEIHICDYLGWCYEQKENLEKAIFYYKEGDVYRESIIPSHLAFEGLASRAICHLNLKQYDEFEDVVKKYSDYSTLVCLINGERFYRGWGTEVDYVRARAAYEKAIDCDIEQVTTGIYQVDYSVAYADACYRLYEIYSKGLGCPKDNGMAKEYFKEALKNGSSSALYDDQKMYEQNKN